MKQSHWESAGSLLLSISASFITHMIVSKFHNAVTHNGSFNKKLSLGLFFKGCFFGQKTLNFSTDFTVQGEAVVADILYSNLGSIELRYVFHITTVFSYTAL